MGSTANGPIKKLSDIRKRRAMARRYGSDKPHASKAHIDGATHRITTEYLYTPDGRWCGLKCDYVPVEAKVVALRKPEDRKPTGFVRQCRTRWDKR